VKKFFRIVALCAAALLVGFVFSFGFEPYSQWYAPLVSLMLMILLSKPYSTRVRFGLWYLFGLGFLGPLLHWTSIYVGAMPWIILILGQSFFFALLAFGQNRGALSPFVFASLPAVSEFLRATVPFGGFGWGRLGFSQLDGPIQGWLRIGGVATVGWVGAFIACSIVIRSRKNLLVALGFLIVPFGSALAASATSGGDEAYRVGLIQGGVSQLGLDFNATPQEVFNRHFAETEALIASEKVDLILWPENASDIDPITNSSVSKRIDSVINSAKTSLVIGAVTQSETGPENVSLHYQSGLGLVSQYQKRDLVPFGEYVPLRDFARRFSPLVDTVKDFVPGRGVSVHRVGGMSFSPLICFEVLDDEIVREAIKVSTIGVIQTNNATFGRSPQSAQQYQISRVRAYENQLPFLVAATTGPTALISADGKTLERLPDFKSGHLVVEVAPTTPSLPPIRRIHIFSFSLILLILAFAFHIQRRRLGTLQS